MHKILMRADADAKSGTGDLFSLLSFSEYLTGWKRYFVTKDTKEARAILSKNGVRDVLYIPRTVSIGKEIDRMNRMIDAEKIDAVLIEITAADTASYKDIAAPYRACVDFYGKVPRGFDLVINWDTYAEKLYDRREYPGTRFLLGPEYAFLRRSVAGKANSAMRRPGKTKRAKKVLIFLGGFDEFDFTLKTVKALEKMDAGLELNIILGAGYKGERDLSSYLSHSGFFKYRIRRNIGNMPAEYGRSDLAIIAGGLSIFEAVALKVPAAVIATYGHQVKRSLFFEKTGSAIYLGFRRISVPKLKRAVSGYRFTPFRERILTGKIPGIIDEGLNDNR
ncbi:MAG: glycosyltransferase [Candidatus Omnitrophota bacterium]